jgi:hypothetical protein
MSLRVEASGVTVDVITHVDAVNFTNWQAPGPKNLGNS